MIERGSEPYAKPNIPLEQHHIDKLKSSAISPDVARERGYESIYMPSQLIPIGYTRLQAENVYGLLIPQYNFLGGQNTSQYRPDNPRTNAKGKPVKYETPRNRERTIDVHPRLIANGQLNDITVPIIFTESTLKADSGISQGLCTLAINGVYNWRTKTAQGASTILGAFESIPLRGRKAVIAFDSDTSSNTNVWNGLRRFANALKPFGANVYYSLLPNTEDGEKQGLDDFFAANHSVDDFWQTVTAKLPPAPKEHDPTKPIAGYNLTDLGNADRFKDAYKGKLLYCHPWKMWLYWDGKHWLRDSLLRTEDLGKRLVRSWYADAQQLTDDVQRSGLLKHTFKSESSARIHSMIELSQSPDYLGVNPDSFDTNKFLLTVRNGTVDLTTGELQPHDPTDLITHFIPYSYYPDSQSDDWDEFIRLVSNNDEATADYLQRVAGYCLTGSTKEGSFFYLLGPTRTGKTTFIQALRDTLGTYALKTSFDTFLSGRRPGNPRPEIADMEGKRLVIASEVTHGQRFDEAMLKEITAGDSVTARQLYAANREYVPQLKLFLAANDFPFIRADDSGAWARLHLTMFNNQELASRLYLNLKQRIIDPTNTDIHEAILTWAVNGTLKWLEDDSLKTPPVTLKTTNEMRDNMKPLKDWMDECTERIDYIPTPLDVLYTSYINYYMMDKTTKTLGKKGFSEALINEGFTKERKTKGMMIRGIRLSSNSG